MSDRPINEKVEEKEEKERGKHEEKTMEEKWRRDPLGAVTWAAILIYAGLVLLADNLGLLARLPEIRLPQGLEVVGFRPHAWALIFLGAGVIVLVEVAIRLLVPAYRQAVTGSIIFAFVLIGIGLSNWIGWEFVWPLILIAIGLSLVVRSLLRR
jgi:hypothetical protein